MTNERKKQLLYVSGIVLALGASLTMGLLSFGGFYAMYPSISLGLGSFTLASIYEGEIYLQSIRQAMTKLFSDDYFDNELAGEMINQILECKEGDQLAFPDFFKDYQLAVKNKESLSSHSPGSKEEDKALKELSLMRRYFLKAINGNLKQQKPYAKNLIAFIQASQAKGEFDFSSLQKQAKKKQKLITLGKYFSLLTGALFSFGSVYLILDTLATLTFIALPLPAVIGLSLVCGAAYGFLIYNTISDMIWNETLEQWCQEVKESINNAVKSKEKSSIINAITLSLGSVLLISLATCLTIFTAGTWWTIAKDIKNLPPLLKRVPAFVTQIVIPSITATATLIFTLENTKASLDEVIEAFTNLPSNLAYLSKKIIDTVKDLFNNKKDNTVPRYKVLNPFNFLIFILETPLRIIGFILHIASVGVTTNRFPGVSKLIMAFLSMLSEGFEDLHFFTGGNKGEYDKNQCNSHNHNNDIPTKIINFIIDYSGLRNLSYAWDSQGNNWLSEPEGFYNLFARPVAKDNCSQPEKQKQSTECLKALTVMQLDDEIASIKDNDVSRTEEKAALIVLSEQVSDIDSEHKDEKARLLNIPFGFAIKSDEDFKKEDKTNISKSLSNFGIYSNKVTEIFEHLKESEVNSSLNPTAA